jgi:hypothetical protein
MHDLKTRLRRYASIPPGRLWRLAVRRIRTSVKRAASRLGDRHYSSYALGKENGAIFRHLKNFPFQEAIACSKSLATITEHYLAHRFDLLGSGWVRVHHGVECRGLEGYRYDDPTKHSTPFADRINPANRLESSRLTSLLEGEYTPIDWQIDFKSGFRWREDCWYKGIAIHTHRPGTDIKVPWELARCQHMPQLALAFGLAKAGNPGFRSSTEYQREYRNQVIDFIANNPPRFGVNWSCPMEIGIRVANWLLAYDLFVSAGAAFGSAFERIFKRSVYEHGRHLAANLEWNDAFRSNHYLADLVGLLCAGAYLPASEETDSWIRFSAHELRRELALQFNNDGSNFEGSTSYHRLSAEIFSYATALMFSAVSHRLPLPWPEPTPRWGPRSAPAEKPIMSCGDIIPPDLAGRLERAAEFTMHVTRPDGHVTQVGDNDSGRLFKLQPAYTAALTQQIGGKFENLSGHVNANMARVCLTEDSLNHRHLVGALGVFFGRADFSAFAEPFRLDAAIILGLCGDCRLVSDGHDGSPTRASMVRIGSDEDFGRIEQTLPAAGSQHYRFTQAPPGWAKQNRFFAYPDFGLFLIKNARLFLAVRCGPVGQAGNGGHAHNDQLGVELVIDGVPRALDPGTYLYTAQPLRRNDYRSVHAHFAPQVDGMEPGNLSQLFALPDSVHARCLYFGSRGFIGCHLGYGKAVYRVIALEDDAIEIRDYADGLQLARCRFSVTLDRPEQFIGMPFSPGYGQRQHNTQHQ